MGPFFFLRTIVKIQRERSWGLYFLLFAVGFCSDFLPQVRVMRRVSVREELAASGYIRSDSGDGESEESDAAERINKETKKKKTNTGRVFS